MIVSVNNPRKRIISMHRIQIFNCGCENDQLNFTVSFGDVIT